MRQFRKVERAKAIIQDGKELFLKECAAIVAAIRHVNSTKN